MVKSKKPGISRIVFRAALLGVTEKGYIRLKDLKYGSWKTHN